MAVFPFVKSPGEVMKAAFDYGLTRDDPLPFAIANLVNYEMIEFAVLVRPMFEAGQVISRTTIPVCDKIDNLGHPHWLFRGAPSAIGAVVFPDSFSAVVAKGLLSCTPNSDIPLSRRRHIEIFGLRREVLEPF
jgi:hypothetical protein